MLNLLNEDQLVYSRDGETYLQEGYWKLLLQHSLIVDGSFGGLVMGPSHDEGGITLIQLTQSNEVKIIAEIEGYEYICSPPVTAKFDQRLDTINSHFNGYETFVPYDVPKEVTVINANKVDLLGIFTADRFVLCDFYKTWVINRIATQSHLLELEAMHNR